MKPKATDSFSAFPALDRFRSYPDVILAVGILSILFVILIPLPPGLVDPLLILNLTISVVVLLTAACVSKPLDFSVFPSLLLVATFFRLALNIATTRLILGNAADGQMAAGKVVLTFGGFVAGDNPIIGMIIFFVIIVVQFVVLTKGATRVSEVAARFQLDAMPGKQMSIDGDLAAGLIDQNTARKRRQEISHEADFYGAMDGASKFVRGDAVAGLVIVLINILGGIAVGFFYHEMSLVQAVNVFSRLTIGDGLVSQVPALMVSIAAALLVTRSAASEHLGKDLSRQVLANDQVLFVAAVFLLFLTPSGLPVPALLVLSATCAVCGYILRRERQLKKEGEQSFAQLKPESATPTISTPSSRNSRLRTPEEVRNLMRVEPLSLEIGYRLLPLMDDGTSDNLLTRLSEIRESLALSLGLVVPPVALRDSRALGPKEYSFRLRGNAIGRWAIEPHGLLAVARKPGEGGLDLALPEGAKEPVLGPVLDGKRSFWLEDPSILPELDEDFDFLRPLDVMSRHLEQVIELHAADILTREEVSKMLASLRSRAPSLVDDLIPHVLKISDLHRIFQGLLREGVSIRDSESILETLGSLPDRLSSVERGVEEVRRTLARSVCAPAVGADGKLHVILIDPALEEFLSNSLETVDGSSVLQLDPHTTDSICERTAQALAAIRPGDFRPAILCSPDIRPHLWPMVGGRVPKVVVLSYDEVLDDGAVEVHGSVCLDAPGASLGANKEEVLAER